MQHSLKDYEHSNGDLHYTPATSLESSLLDWQAAGLLLALRRQPTALWDGTTKNSKLDSK